MKKVLLLFLLFNIHCALYTAQAQCTAVSITTQPQNQNDSIPGAAHFNVTVSGSSPFNYYWYKNGVVVDSTVNSASATNNYNTPPLTMADSSNTYYCIITNCSGLNSVTSNVVHLICIPVSISIQPLSQTFTAGAITTISFSVTVNGTPPFTYRWYRNPNTLVKTTIDTVGHTSIYTFYANPVVYGMNGNAYHVVISNYCNGGGGGGSGLNTVVSGNAVVTVGCPTMAAPDITGPINDICGENYVNLSTTPVAGATYNWTGGTGPGGSSSSNYSAIPYTNFFACSTQTDFSLTITVNGCTSPMSTWQTISYQAPSLNNPPSNLTICSGGTVSYIPSIYLNCYANLTISHTSPSFITGFSTSGNSINDLLVNTGTVPCTATYTIMLTNNACWMWPQYFSFTVTVNPAPTVTVNSPTICAGQTATLTASGTATSYTWSAGATPTGVNTATVSPTVTTSYTVTGTNSYGCTKTAVATVTVSGVNPTVTVNSPTICSGESATLTAGGATSYTWAGGASSTGVNTASASPTVTTTYTVTGTNSCGSSTAVATVTVHQTPATPTVIISGNTLVGCTQNLTLTTSSVAGASYLWSGQFLNSSTGQTVTAIAPGGMHCTTYSYSVTVTVNGCTSPSGASQTTINGYPTIVNSPSNQTICSGGTVSYIPLVQECYFFQGTGANYLHSNSSCITGATSGFGSINNVLINNSAIPCSITYTVTPTQNNCSGGNSLFTVTVNPAPTVSVNSPTICAGQTATLTASGTATSYTWSAGATPTGANTATVSPTVTTTYTVTGTNSYGCTKTAVSTVTVSGVNPTVSVNSPTICSGESATLTAGGATSYTWSGGAISSGANTATASPITTTNYTVTGTDTQGCSNTATSTVTVNPTPTITVNSPAICLGQTATLIASGGNNYVWSAGATPVNTDSATASPIATTSYSVTTTDANGCSNTAVSIVTVNPSSAIAVNSPTICAGQTATLTATGGNSYVWSAGADSIGVNMAGANPASTSTYTVIGTNACGVDSAFATVTVNPVPTVSANSPTICSGETATLTANGASTYTWSVGATPTGVNTAEAGPLATTTYTITGTDNGCSTTTTSTVTVNNVNAGITQAADTLTSNQSNATYQWYNCTLIGYVLIPGAISQSYIATANGSYAVAVTVGNCIDTSVCVNYYSVGTNELTMENGEWTIYPNPTEGLFQVSSFKFQIKRVEIYNLLGECVLVPPPSLQGGGKGVVLDMSGFAKGIYFVEVVATDSQIKRKKIVLQ